MHQAIISKEISAGKLFRLKMKSLWPFQNSPSQGIKNISLPITNKYFTLKNKSLLRFLFKSDSCGSSFEHFMFIIEINFFMISSVQLRTNLEFVLRQVLLTEIDCQTAPKTNFELLKCKMFALSNKTMRMNSRVTRVQRLIDDIVSCRHQIHVVFKKKLGYELFSIDQTQKTNISFYITSALFTFFRSKLIPVYHGTEPNVKNAFSINTNYIFYYIYI